MWFIILFVLLNSVVIISLAIFADDTIRVAIWPKYKNIRGPYILLREGLKRKVWEFAKVVKVANDW